MIELSMLEAAVFQLRSAMATIEDEFALTQMRISLSAIENALVAARDGVNAARVNDLAFALGDFASAVDQLSTDDSAAILPLLELLQKDLAALQSATALPDAAVHNIRAFQAKLRARRSAIERQTMSGETSDLPHSPEELREDAMAIRDQLESAGFATPALDHFIEEPETLRFHSINEIFDELEVIAD